VIARDLLIRAGLQHKRDGLFQMSKLPKLFTALSSAGQLLVQVAMVFGFAFFAVQTPSVAQPAQAHDAFTEEAASKLLSQVAQGLQGHVERTMLGAFDLSLMEDGPIFKQQITAFFDQYDTIRVHFKLEEVKDNVAVVDAELDETPRNEADPPRHKSTEIRFTGVKTEAGWKFIDVQPRDFFS